MAWRDATSREASSATRETHGICHCVELVPPVWRSSAPNRGHRDGCGSSSPRRSIFPEQRLPRGGVADFHFGRLDEPLAHAVGSGFRLIRGLGASELERGGSTAAASHRTLARATAVAGRFRLRLGNLRRSPVPLFLPWIWQSGCRGGHIRDSDPPRIVSASIEAIIRSGPDIKYLEFSFLCLPTKKNTRSPPVVRPRAASTRARGRCSRCSTPSCGYWRDVHWRMNEQDIR